MWSNYAVTTGLFLQTVIVWLVTWAIAHEVLAQRRHVGRRLWIVSGVLLGLGMLFSFTTLLQLAAAGLGGVGTFIHARLVEEQQVDGAGWRRFGDAGDNDASEHALVGDMTRRSKPRWQKDGESAVPERRPPDPPFGLRPDVAPSSGGRLGPAQATALVAVLAIVVLALVVLPQVLRLSRASHPTLVTDLAGQGAGAYLSTSGGFYKLRPSPELPSFPQTSATVAPGVTVVMRARGQAQADRYLIVSYGSRTAVAANVRRLGRSTLELQPAHDLAPGRYFVQMPAGSASGNQAFFYFQVVATASGSPTPTPASTDTATPTPAESPSATPTPTGSDTATPNPASSDAAAPGAAGSDVAAPDSTP